MTNKLFDDRDMVQIENTATRLPVVLCLDTSKSMDDNGGFEALNKGVKAFYDTGKNDPARKYGFDVAIVTFGAQGVTPVQDFRPIWNQEEIPQFVFTDKNWIDGTPMGRGVDMSIKGLEKRIVTYKDNSISNDRPWLVIITDGEPAYIYKQGTEEYEAEIEAFDQTVSQVITLQKNKNLNVIAIGVGAEDFRQLAEFVIDKKVLTTKDFSEFSVIFESMSKSMAEWGTSNKTEANDSPIARVMEDLTDEGVNISIQDYGRDED